jgi:mRNA-degrading endonuclease RelE of RelBE toxin-antitoxin system
VLYEVWLSKDATKDRKRLSKAQEKKLLWWGDSLASDPMVGNSIQKSLIPSGLKEKYEINNLWRLELPEGWRILYTIASRPARIPQVSILRILSHKDYDRLFHYSARGGYHPLPTHAVISPITELEECDFSIFCHPFSSRNEEKV